MPEKTLEEMANELLLEAARAEGVLLRDLGIIDRHRARKINDHEIPMSSTWSNLIPAHARTTGDDDWENE